MKRYLLPILFSALLITLLAMYVSKSSSREISKSNPQNTPIFTQTKQPMISKPSPTQPLLPSIPELDTTSWKLYTEKGQRYHSRFSEQGDITITETGYKKYTFKYPNAWIVTTDPKVVTAGRNTGVILTNPNTGYSIRIGYAANRDYSTDELYTLPNGMRVEGSEFGREYINEDGIDQNIFYTLPNAKDDYGVVVETTKTDINVIYVSVPITDSEAIVYNLDDIAVGRAVVKSFNLVK